MSRCGLLAWLLAAACGGGSHGSTTTSSAIPSGGEDEPPDAHISIVPTPTTTWYRAATVCGQGPYEIEVPVSPSKYGEEVELRLATPRRVALNAVIVGDDDEVIKTAALFDRDGRGTGKAENLRCVADAKERVVAVRNGGGGGGGAVVPDVPVGKTIVVTPPPATPPQRLEVVDGEDPLGSIQVIRFGWRDVSRRVKRIRIRLWSVEPNDLDRVRFGVVKIDWKPNVPEVEYEAHLERLRVWEVERQRKRAELQRQLDEENRRRAEQARLRLEEERRREEEYRRLHPPPPRSAAELEAERERQRREAEEEKKRQEREEHERVRRIEILRQLEIKRIEEQRQRDIEAALELERRKRRAVYCESHHESRDCWGVGGKARRDEFALHDRERGEYCAAHGEDVRCWSNEEGARRRGVWQKRVDVATAPPKQPDGPPPAPHNETPPPKLSANAEWRPGYWLWTGETWIWLGGMWRVPEEDIASEQTTTAPIAPPPPRVEEIPPPPMPTTIWVTGFWQWNGKSYIWVAGSYQARPEVGVAWRPAEWRVRGARHVLIPGGWVKRGRR